MARTLSSVQKLRVVYGLALATVMANAIWFMIWFTGVAAASGLHSVLQFIGVFYAVTAVSFALGSAPLIVLTLRPAWWGKLLLPLYGLSWMMFAGMATIMALTGIPYARGAWPAAPFGAVMLALAVIHHMIDPAFSKSRSGETS